VAQLTPKALLAVLGSDDVEVRCENTIYQVAKFWWRHSRFSPAFKDVREPFGPGLGTRVSWPISRVRDCDEDVFGDAKPPAYDCYGLARFGVAVATISSACSIVGVVAKAAESTRMECDLGPSTSIVSCKPGAIPSTLHEHLGESIFQSDLMDHATCALDTMNFALELLECVRFPHLTTGFLLDVAKREHAFCISSSACHHRTLDPHADALDGKNTGPSDTKKSSRVTTGCACCHFAAVIHQRVVDALAFKLYTSARRDVDEAAQRIIKAQVGLYNHKKHCL
jgi:hypothetical protein